jgi:hypothetical protein
MAGRRAVGCGNHAMRASCCLHACMHACQLQAGPERLANFAVTAYIAAPALTCSRSAHCETGYRIVEAAVAAEVQHLMAAAELCCASKLQQQTQTVAACCLFDTSKHVCHHL